MDAMPTVPVDLRPYSGHSSKMRESADITQIAPALVHAQAAIGNPPRNRFVKVQTKAGGTYTFRYATLDKITEMTRPALAANGLCVLQPIVSTERGAALVTRLLHESGQWMECEFPLPGPRDDPQAFGSAVTYLRRYSVLAMLNLTADEDDDGNRAAGNHVQDLAPRGGKEARQKDGHALALTDGRAGTSGPVQALINRANAAESVADGQALLEAWQRDAAGWEQHRGGAEWGAMERALWTGLRRSLGLDLATLFVTALRATDAQQVAAVQQQWDGKWAKTLRAVEQQAPAIHAALARHVAAQAARVRNAQRQPPQEPHGPNGGKAGGDNAPADRSDTIMAAHGQDGAPG